MIEFKGNRWYKCDLHLHTPASKCFQDKTVTAQQWVQRAIEQGLNCVAVTDHNTGQMIDEIKQAAKGTTLTVFPGVEITCDTSKVHLLIIFDIEKSTDTINDFLIRCGIDRNKFSEQDAFTSQSIIQVASIAHAEGAIVIPAHIDEFNGLESISYSVLEDFYSKKYINAVQVVHKDFVDPNFTSSQNHSFKDSINAYYNSSAIDFVQISNWHKPVKKAIEAKKAILTFSDNPHEPKNSKHGLAGIGTRYTWIKMGETANLEGLRQAFLMPDNRIRNDFDTNQVPFIFPDLWIKSVVVKNTAITGADTFKVNFNPQLTTIIGGRGSGKSSILRFLRGVFNKTADINELREIFADQSEFYYRNSGVIQDSTEIIVELYRNKILHRITVNNITNSTNQNISILKQRSEDNVWEQIEDEGYFNFFDFEQFSQKQIFEIAKEPNSLRERIDKHGAGIEELKAERDLIRNEFLEKSASIRTYELKVANKGQIETEIKDLVERIAALDSSGINSTLKVTNRFSTQKKSIDNFITQFKSKEDEIVKLKDSLDIKALSDDTLDEKYHEEISQISQSASSSFESIINTLTKAAEDIKQIREKIETEISETIWKKDFDTNLEEFRNKKEQLERDGIDDITKYEEMSLEKSKKQEVLAEVNESESGLGTEREDRKKLQERYLAISKQITRKRQEYVNGILDQDKLKITFKPFRNRGEFTNKFRAIIQRPHQFEQDIESLMDSCFNGNVELTVKVFTKKILDIYKGESVDGVSGYFLNLVKSLSDSQIDEIELTLPEDEIDIKYKPQGSNAFKSLSIASAGQKTTAILTFILSQGKAPLILDQPEDDLDNKLVYELIVDRLKDSKERRQIVVVTHNANIPVNGDAELIISMDSESQVLKVLHEGTVDQSKIKKEICDVMEGTEYAFKMRSKRYEQIGE
ncbi:MAG: TrlF family AAA-like ATPase [Bacteroidia bacterium]